ncbi:histidine phosphatase superfamily [Chaetomidium leptoderma]|uniref:Histidine phosphatase superfamily n=1 Tax=Chaetomidium leptoderma TaxID=669021 RepID=A0AAN6ZX59_9PEZI|nr:histidine phosphatase superfamily [Chaetomidium leptoderma]
MASLSMVLALLVPTSLAGPSNERVWTIDHSHLNVESSTDHCSSASAIAFMQGLYPPWPHTPCDLDIPDHTRFANGSILNYPMFGYQYPNIRTISPNTDPDSIWSHGHDHCSTHEESLLMFSNNSIADSIHQSHKVFYSSLWDKVFCDAFPRSQANFYNAHDLTRSAMSSADLEKLRELAWHEQTLKHADMSGTGSAQSDLTSSIAGRTLASRVTALFAENIESHGERNKLNLAFTSHEPFLGFFALTNLTTGASSHLFSRLPDSGATLTFELFSVDSDATADSYNNNNDSYNNTDSCNDADPYDAATGSYNDKSRRGYDDDDDDCNDEKTDTYSNNNNPDTYKQPTSPHNPPTTSSHNNVAYPPIDKLYVRFLYQNDTANPQAPLTPCPLFGSNRPSMSFKHFNATMWQIGIANATKWCKVCKSDARFCAGADPRHKSHHLLAGLLGSASTLVVVALVLAL